MTEKEKFEEWKNAKWEDYKEKLPEGTSELAFLHSWMKYGVIHNYFIVALRQLNDLTQKG